jgi:simple sugar transport system ATP-binding protein
LRARIAELARSHDLGGGADAAAFAERRISELSVGERQRVEILRALFTDPQLLILDEPTAVLTPQAVEKLFLTLRRLAAGGCSILYISHKLDEVRALCSSCTIMRAGRVTGSIDPRTATNAQLSELMLGAQPPARVQPPSAVARSAVGTPPALEVRGLTLPRRERFGVTLQDLRFTLRGGEILGVAGISGSGQGELLDAISGEDPRVPAGVVHLAGADVSRASTRARRALGLRTVPEERIGRGAIPSLSLAANTLLTRREPVARGGWLRWPAARALAGKLMRAFDVRARGPEATAGSLSGGNLQKFIVGREVDAGPKVLLVAQPTWGLDVGAAAAIRNHLTALAARGVAVLVISEDLPELFELCTELVVLARGRLSPRVPVAEATVAQLGEWMSGLFPDGSAPPPDPVIVSLGPPGASGREAHP